MNAKFLFFSLEGRISRTWWWVGMLSVLLIGYGLSIALLWLIGGDPSFHWNDKNPTPKTALAEVIAFLITLRFSLAVDIKRIHDRSRTAYLLVPVYLGELALFALDGTGLNPLYFPPRDETGSALLSNIIFGLILILLAYFVWLIIELGLGRGTRGANKYGPDPLAPLTPPDDETI